MELLSFLLADAVGAPAVELLDVEAELDDVDVPLFDVTPTIEMPIIRIY